MAINRVDFGGNTLIDLTGDTLESAEQLLKGIIAHAKDGSQIVGTLEAGGGADISPWIDMVAFSITPAEDLTGDIDFTSFLRGRTSKPDIFILGQRADTSGSPYVNSLAQINTLYSWSRLYYTASLGTSSYPSISMNNGIFKVKIGNYKLETGVLYWGAMLWR